MSTGPLLAWKPLKMGLPGSLHTCQWSVPCPVRVQVTLVVLTPGNDPYCWVNSQRHGGWRLGVLNKFCQSKWGWSSATNRCPRPRV